MAIDKDQSPGDDPAAATVAARSLQLLCATDNATILLPLPEHALLLDLVCLAAALAYYIPELCHM